MMGTTGHNLFLGEPDQMLTQQDMGAVGQLQAENQSLASQMSRMHKLIESLQKQLALKDLIIEELTGEGNTNETFYN